MSGKPPRVLITGAGSGIGRALAIEAGRRGMSLALCGRRKQLLQETAAQIGSGEPALILDADITDPQDRSRIVTTLSAQFNGLEFLFNNAGVVIGGALANASDEDVEETFRTNVIAPILLTRDLLALMPKGSARVINIGSIFGDIAYPGFSVYSASKFALRGFSDGLRRELKSKGIALTYVAPRATRTPAAVAFEFIISNSTMKLDEPPAVARHIWDHVERGRNHIYPPGLDRLFVLIERLCPAIIDRALAKRSP